MGGRDESAKPKALALTERNPWDQGARCASLGFVRRPSASLWEMSTLFKGGRTAGQHDSRDRQGAQKEFYNKLSPHTTHKEFVKI